MRPVRKLKNFFVDTKKSCELCINLFGLKAMAEIFYIKIRCFLCRRKSSSSKSYNPIETTKCQVSGKTIKDVLKHLARSANAELHIAQTDSVCYYCHCQLMEYDSIMVKLLKTQKSLMKLVEDAISGYESDVENECDKHMSTMDELNDETFFNDFEISDSEISQTVNEATHESSNKYTVAPKRTRSSQLFNDELQCQFCVMKFKSKAKLHIHNTEAHRKFSCELCDFSHRNEDYVLLHMNLHEGRSENQCKFCDKQFTTKISTIRHMEVHMNSKKYQCDKCGLCFSQTTVLYNHKLQHEAEEDPLRCEVCNQVFKTKRTYRHHMITHQANRPRYSCEHCSKTFTEKYTLKVHMRTHTAVANMEEQAAAAVQSITNSNQQAEAKFNCIICEQCFISKESLNKHMEKEHDVILKSLTLTNFSQYDVVTHEPRKPCQVCGHMFSTQTNLDFHLERVHGLEFK